MRRRSFLASTLGLVCISTATRAQGALQVRRIGWLTTQRVASLAPYINELRGGLADLGYKEGDNLRIEYRYANDEVARVPELATELVGTPVELIVAQGAAVTVLRRLTPPVPVVYVTSGDPVLAGLAESFARPGGNMTGMTFMSPEMNVERLELLRELVPELRRVGIIANPEHPGEQLERTYLEETGRRLGLTLMYFQTRNEVELANAFQRMAADPPQAICVTADGFAVQNRHIIIDFAMRRNMPVISAWLVFAQAGALCTYGPRLSASYRRLAYYVDRVLKGAKPADLPIERPTTFELILNLKTARSLGVTVPPTILTRADEVIE